MAEQTKYEALSDAGSEAESEVGPWSLRHEVKKLSVLAGPIAIGYLSTTAMVRIIYTLYFWTLRFAIQTTIDLGFVGYLGTDELSAMSLANVVMMATFGEQASLAAEFGT